MDENFKSVWSDIRKKDRYRAISDLVRESQPNGSYYSLLILSSIIISAGVLLGNASVLIGGMLVTPVLTPILLIALAIVTSKPIIIHKTSILILKSIGLVMAVSFMASLIFGVGENNDFINSVIINTDNIRGAFLYFLVALASGVAATFAWIRKEVNDILPGISIAVSLVPPMSLVGVWVAQQNFENARFFLFVFLFNLFGILMSSVVVFSVLQFYKAGDEVVQTFKTAQNGNDKKYEKNENKKESEKKF